MVCVHWACVIGPPAAGKTKQAELLAEAFPDDISVISVPQLLRDVPEAADAIAAGRLVPDDVVDAAVQDALTRTREGALVLLAGYPATRAQAQRVARNGIARFAVALNVPEDALREKILQSGHGDSADQKIAGYREHTAPTEVDLQNTAGLRVVDGTLAEHKIHEQLRATALAPTLLPRELVQQPTRSSTDGAVRFSVCQMNVLADGLSGNTATRGGFSLMPPMYLSWAHRSQMLLKALYQSGDGDDGMPDIVALQEADHIDDFWNVQMRALGYEGESRVDPLSPCLEAALVEPRLPDSVAVFWKRDVFELSGEVEKGVDLMEEGETLVYKSKMLFLRLRIIATGQCLAVINCHLDSKKNESGVEVRAKQSEAMLSRLSKFAENTSGVILCGDLNAPRGERCHNSILESDLMFTDVYSQAGFGEQFTSMKARTGSFKAGVSKYAVDHMFYAGATCSPTHVLSLPQEDSIGSTGLPSPNWPSDHLSLYVRFEIDNPSTGNPLSFEDESQGTPDALRKSGITDAAVLDDDSSQKRKGVLDMCCGR